MEMHERIKKVRKYNNMTQNEFAEHLGVTRSVISNIELNRLAKPEQKASLIKLISKEFSVNEEWLLYGTGEMFIPTTNDKLKQLSVEYNLSKLEETFFNSYLNLDEKKRETVCQFFEDILSKSFSFLSNDLAATVDEENFEEYKRRELEAYALELDAESKGEILSASEKLKNA